MAIRNSFFSEVPPQCHAAMALAESLARAHASRGGNLAELFSAYVGVVVDRDEVVGRDCLTAVDRWVNGTDAQ